MVKKNRGFTLIELMVVIVIIGILATLGLVSYRNALIRARDSKAMGDVKDIVTAQEQLRAVSGISGAYANLGAGTECTLGPLAGTDYSVPDGNPNPYLCYAGGGGICVMVQMENAANGNCSSCSCTAAGCTAPAGTANYCVVGKQ